MKKFVFTLAAVACIGISEINAQEQKTQEVKSTPETKEVTPKKSGVTTVATPQTKALKLKAIDQKVQAEQPAVSPARTEERKQEPAKKEEEK
jgi:hypothetical protein